MHKKVALISLLIILGLVNWSILEKEKHLAEGRVVYLKLMPVDPRSIMQGDYMALRFYLAAEVYKVLPKVEKSGQRKKGIIASDGYVVVGLDKKNIGTYKRLYKNEELSPDELLMRYRVRNDKVKFATNAFFFQEGHAHYYEKAQYGQFRVDDNGELLLSGLYDNELKRLQPEVRNN
ncbi:MAG: GDYXXLXY domain-containing protein [Nitrospinae bacterium]|nr:GDYXXLXY domain-containing protein [Nitrospinota bacterium]